MHLINITDFCVWMSIKGDDDNVEMLNSRLDSVQMQLGMCGIMDRNSEV